MRTTQNLTPKSVHAGRLPVMPYEPAVLKEWPTGWQIEYRIFNPASGILEKRRIRFEKIRKRMGNDAQCRQYARKYCQELNRRLSDGLSPVGDNPFEKKSVSLKDSLALFIREKEVELKNGSFRQDSFTQYSSWLNVFRKWLASRRMLDASLEAFGRESAVQYLDSLYLEKSLSARTYNNYLLFMRTLWSLFIEKGYIAGNPFLRIRPKAKCEKQRAVIPSEASGRIMACFRR